MSKLKELLENNYKVVLIAVFILVLVLVLIFTSKINKNKLKEYVPIEYSYFAMYSTDNKVGVIDKKGNIVIEPNYVDIYIPNPSKDVFVCFETTDEYKFLNSKNEELYTNFDEVDVMQTSESKLDFEKNFIKFKKGNKYGLIDYSGKEVLSAEYESIQSLENKPGEILVKKDGKYGVIDESGKLKLEIKYDMITGDEFYSEKYGYSGTRLYCF